jgi:hypothetical protein
MNGLEATTLASVMLLHTGSTTRDNWICSPLQSQLTLHAMRLSVQQLLQVCRPAVLEKAGLKSAAGLQHPHTLNKIDGKLPPDCLDSRDITL